MNAPLTVVAQRDTALAGRRQFDLAPQNFEQALQFAEYLAASEMVPKQYRNKPGDCLIAMQWGYELGFQPLQALQSIASINGKPSVYGDAGKAILLNAGCEIIEDDIEDIQKNGIARCTIHRPGKSKPTTRSFSVENAKTANLWNKEGPWRSYPWRQMAWRAFWFAARDAAADLLRGFSGFEEMIDAGTSTQQPAGPAPLVEEVKPTTYPEDQFAANLPKWVEVMKSGRKTPDQIIAMANSKHPLTDEQKQRVRDAGTPQAATGPTPAVIEQHLRDAQDIDSLNAAADLINSITDTAENERLSALYDDLMGRMTQE